MQKIVNLRQFRNRQIERRAFDGWQKRYGETFDRTTRFSDLSDCVLLSLAQPGETNAQPYYELIMGVFDWGNPVKFYYLSDEQRMRVIDIHLFLADLVRFELMKRLGWVEWYAGEGDTILDLVRRFDKLRVECRNNPPRLAETHSAHAEYCALTSRDQEVFIRRLLPEALETFKQQ